MNTDSIYVLSMSAEKTVPFVMCFHNFPDSATVVEQCVAGIGEVVRPMAEKWWSQSMLDTAFESINDK